MEVEFYRTGDAGSQGLQGNVGFIEPEIFDDTSMIPGPQGNTGSTGPAAIMTDFTKDLGAADRSGTFDITGLSGLTTDKVVTVIQTAAKITSKGDARDEFEMDNIQLTGYVVDANTIRVYWQAPSVVVGTYAFAYQVSG